MYPRTMNPGAPFAIILPEANEFAMFPTSLQRSKPNFQPVLLATIAASATPGLPESAPQRFVSQIIQCSTGGKLSQYMHVLIS